MRQDDVAAADRVFRLAFGTYLGLPDPMQFAGDADWVGMASRTVLGTDGIGMTDTQLFDAQGAIGRALQTLYVAPR